MLDIREIEYWISRHEAEAAKLDDCVVLAALYTIRDRLAGPEAEAPRSLPVPLADEPLGLYGDSEFLRAVAGVPAQEAWAVMDELMETLRVVYPRVYERVVGRLGEL